VKKFPHLVEMHKKLGPRGLVVISVHAEDEAIDREQQGRVLKFLQKQDATQINLILDEPMELWGKKLDIDLKPCLYVFNRLGEWKRFDAYELVEKGTQEKADQLIEDWLKQR